MGKIFLFLSMFFAILANASVVGSVSSLQGSVKVKSEGSFKKVKASVGFELHSGDLVTTSRRGSVIIKLVDGSDVILDKSSIVHFDSNNLLEQKDGKVFYKITSRDAKNSLKIKTSFAIIGIKGTTFVINATENASVSLKEGLIGVQSVKAEFELYRKKVQEEFNKYLSEQQSAFERFKSEQAGYATVEHTKKFDLKAGNRISFNGSKVKEDSLDEKDNFEFEHFQQLIDSMK